jgi:hypothetical protein
MPLFFQSNLACLSNFLTLELWIPFCEHGFQSPGFLLSSQVQAVLGHLAFFVGERPCYPLASFSLHSWDGVLWWCLEEMAAAPLLFSLSCCSLDVGAGGM